jgi:hypothetical protein
MWHEIKISFAIEFEPFSINHSINSFFTLKAAESATSQVLLQWPKQQIVCHEMRNFSTTTQSKTAQVGPNFYRFTGKFSTIHLSV